MARLAVLRLSDWCRWTAAVTRSVHGHLPDADRRGQFNGDRLPVDRAARRATRGLAVTTVSVRGLAMQYGRRLVFRELSFDLGAGQAAGVVGPNGSGKTTLLRALAGCLTPRAGEIRINGLTPRDALSRTGVGYFAGEATLPGSVRAAQWGGLGSGDNVTRETRRLRTLSRGTRQLLGLRTVLGRHPLGLIV